MLRNLRYAVEAFFICFVMVFFRLLPLDAASGLGGSLARLIGPFARAHGTARRNIQRVMPELSDRQRAKILGDMWENLGRTFGEYPHLNRTIMKHRITLEGQEHLEKVKRSGKGAIFISGHFANWEIGPLMSGLSGAPLVLVYRIANNPFADWIIRKIRSRYSRAMFGKGRVAATEAIRALKEHHILGMLSDQKQNDGILVPFFGLPAMTAPAMVQLAVKYQVPVLLAHTVRTHGAHFHVILEPEVRYAKGTDLLEAMTAVNMTFERWIRDNPAQWLWLHRRWG